MDSDLKSWLKQLTPKQLAAAKQKIDEKVAEEASTLKNSSVTLAEDFANDRDLGSHCMGRRTKMSLRGKL